MAVHVSYGAIRLEWCDRCLTSSLAICDVYVLAGEQVHHAGQHVFGCEVCDEL
ncbi:hypothetical protein [Nonomuraea wenchangensis]|uniref:hypothetical protein n=1 Tax=Nonomuraea wenchangensis TaxID=568860 RepID=UPI00331B0534